MSSSYETARDSFRWADAWDAISSGDKGHLNVGEEALGRHGDSEDIALRLRDFATGETERYTYAELNAHSNRVANYLTERTEPRARIGAMLPASIELYAVIFGTVKAGRIYVPLSELFGSDSVEYRMADAGVSILFTNREHAEKFTGVTVDSLSETVIVDGDDLPFEQSAEVRGFESLFDYGSGFESVQTHPEDSLGIVYSSGTTGQPKGCKIAHNTLLTHYPYCEYVLDLRSEDTYFVTAAPAWSYGLIAGTFLPGMYETAIGTYRGEFEPEPYLQLLEDFRITNLMAPPTALRQIRDAGLDISEYELSVRILVSGGESLDAATVDWVEETFGVAPLEVYGFTEGAMLVCNYPFDDWDIKPGSMGRPVPGFDTRLVDDEGVDVAPGELGEIAVRKTADAVFDFTGYWGMPERTEHKRSGQWIRSDDLATRDDEGYFWYRSRKDYVIVSAGYRIGPEEVEEALMESPKVEEAGVIGVPDETRGSIVRALVVLAPAVEPSESVKSELRSFTRERLSKHEYPREIEFIESIPKTATGKTKRDELGGL